MKVIHGGNREKIAHKLGLNADQMIDFSANINPAGLSNYMAGILQRSLSQIIYYPNPDYPKLKAAIADHFNVSPQDVMVGNGAVQMIFDVANIVKAKRALVLAPTFGEYERSFVRAGIAVDHFYLQVADQFEMNPDALIDYLRTHDTIDLICLCNPNNPTGSLIKPAAIQQVADYCRDHHKWLIIDEAFMDFVAQDKWSFINQLTTQSLVIILRSATKFFAIPGLRLGFAITKNSALKEVRQQYAEPWSVNTLADQFGQHMYEDTDYIEKTYQWLNNEKRWLFSGLQALPGIQPFNSVTNYYLIKSAVPNLQEKLWHQRVMIRSCADYNGLGADYYRVAVRSHHENEQLMTAMHAVINKPIS